MLRYLYLSLRLRLKKIDRGIFRLIQAAALVSLGIFMVLYVVGSAREHMFLLSCLASYGVMGITMLVAIRLDAAVFGTGKEEQSPPKPTDRVAYTAVSYTTLHQLLDLPDHIEVTGVQDSPKDTAFAIFLKGKYLPEHGEKIKSINLRYEFTWDEPHHHLISIEGLDT